MGMARTAAMRMESSDIFVAMSFSPRVMAETIAGITEMVSGVIKAAGRLNRVWALPYTP